MNEKESAPVIAALTRGTDKTMSFFQNHSIKALVEYYNEIAADLGKTPVARFSDRETAERRCDAIREEVRAKRAADAATNGIAVEQHPSGKANPFQLNEAGQAALAAARQSQAPKAATQKKDDMTDETTTQEKAPFDGVRSTSVRGKFIAALLDAPGTAVPVPALAAATGVEEAKISGIAKYVEGLIVRDGIPFAIAKTPKTADAPAAYALSAV
jgi:hypothetical protein